MTHVSLPITLALAASLAGAAASAFADESGAHFDFLSGQKHATPAAPTASVAAPPQAPAPKAAPSEEIREQAAAWAATVDQPVELVVVGHTGPLHRMDVAERHVFYREYARALARQRPGLAPKIGEDEFVASVGGWSTIETFGLAGFLKIDYPMAVPASQLGAVKFPPVVGSMVTGAHGDLVASRQNADGVLTLSRVLCKQDAADAQRCGAAYEPGRYDAHSGAELDTDLKPKADGRRVDVASYAVQPVQR
jgi:hypothetical protein